MLGLGVIELFTAVTGIATVLLVALAAWQLWLLRQEAQRERRPYVFVEVSKGHTRAGKEGLYLSFTNYGRTPAAKVRAHFQTDNWKLLNSRTFAFEREGGIALLPPGATLSYFIGPVSPELIATYSADRGVDVSLEYSSSETYQVHHDTHEVSLLDSYGAKKPE